MYPRVLYGPLNPEWPYGRTFYYDKVGFGDVYLDSRPPVLSVGHVTVKFADLAGEPAVRPYNITMPRHLFDDPQWTIDSVRRAMDQLGL